MSGLWASTRNLVTGHPGRGLSREVSDLSDRSGCDMQIRDNGRSGKHSHDPEGEYGGQTFSKRGLEAMLRERDETIAAFEKARAVELQMLADVRSSLDELRREYRQELYWRDFEINHMKKERTELLKRLATFQKDLSNEDLVRDIANMIMEDAPKADDNSNDDDMSMSGVSAITTASNYTTKLQSKLRIAMHRMHVMSSQMKNVKASCDDVVKSLQVEINDVVEEKCKIEVELLNRLDMLEHEKRVGEQQMRAKLEYKQRKIEELEENLADLRDMAQDEEAMEDEIEHLKRSNRAKQRKIEQMQEVASVSRGGESKVCGASVVSLTSDDMSMQSDDEEVFSRVSNEDIGPVENGNIISIMTRIARVTSHMEKDVKASLMKREEILNSLSDGKLRVADTNKRKKFAWGQKHACSMSVLEEESKLDEAWGDELPCQASVTDRRRPRSKRGCSTEHAQLCRSGSSRW